MILTVLCLIFAFSVSADGPQKLGTFLPRPALSVYLIGDDQPSSAHIIIRHGQRPQFGRFLIRAFDPDERLILWRYIEYKYSYTDTREEAALNEQQLKNKQIHIFNT